MRTLALLALLGLAAALVGCHDGYHSYSYGYDSGYNDCPPPVHHRRTVVTKHHYYGHGHHQGHGWRH